MVEGKIFFKIVLRPSKKNRLASPPRPLKSTQLNFFFTFYFHSFSLKMFQYYFVMAKLGRSLNWLIENLYFLHSNMMFMYDVVCLNTWMQE